MAHELVERFEDAVRCHAFKGTITDGHEKLEVELEFREAKKALEDALTAKRKRNR